MLLIIADYPNEMNMREGAMQRIDAIDSLIRDRKRVYLNISFKKHLVRSNSSFNNVIVENLNAIIHRNIIKQYMQKSTTIYVHSVYNLLKVITLIDLKKTILDIVGEDVLLIDTGDAIAKRVVALSQDLQNHNKNDLNIEILYTGKINSDMVKIILGKNKFEMRKCEL